MIIVYQSLDIAFGKPYSSSKAFVFLRHELPVGVMSSCLVVVFGIDSKHVMTFTKNLSLNTPCKNGKIIIM